MRDGLYILYEGSNDIDFIDSVLKKLLRDRYGDKIIPHPMASLCINDRIGYIQFARNHSYDYIYMTDLDDDPCYLDKKTNLVKTLKEQNDNNCIIIVRREIESWMYAGLGRPGCQKLKIPFCDDTTAMEKEEFYKIGKDHGYSKVVFKKRVMNLFEVKYAVQFNSSFEHMYRRYITKSQ